MQSDNLAGPCSCGTSGLSIRARRALDRVAAGDTVKKAAEAVGLHRVTVSKLRATAEGKAYLLRAGRLLEDAFVAATVRREVWGNRE